MSRSRWYRDPKLTFYFQIGRWTDESTGWVINGDRHRRSFKGWIDDFRVYDEALEEQEVQALYGDGAGDFQICRALRFPPLWMVIRPLGK